MILRVYRATADAASRTAVIAHLRDRVYPAVARTPGLRSFQAGIADRGDRLEVLLVSTWRDFDAVLAGIGQDLGRPAWLREIERGLVVTAVDHYELVGAEVRGLFPLDGAVVRILRGPLNPEWGETFFGFARERQQEHFESSLVVASHIGRRMVGSAEEAIYVVVWQDIDAPGALGGTPSAPAGREQWEPYFASWDFSAFDALARVPGRRDDPHGVLLADDDRTLVFANAGAGRLVGRPSSRLLGMRIEDITLPELRPEVPELWRSFLETGAQDGPFALVGADGHRREVSYAARANTPWPGCHVSVLAPAGHVPDIEDALSGAGLIARYEEATAPG